MDAKTLAKIVQIVVQEEVSKIVKREMATMRKQIVAEVKRSIPKQKVVKQVVYENGQSQNGLEDMGFDVPDVLPKRKKQPRKKQYANNATINDILNETVAFSNNDEMEDYPTMGGQHTSQNAQGGVGNYREMMAREMGMNQPSTPGNVSVSEMLPKTDDRGMPSRVSANDIDPAVAKALTRDYTDLVKAMTKKKK